MHACPDCGAKARGRCKLIRDQKHQVFYAAEKWKVSEGSNPWAAVPPGSYHWQRWALAFPQDALENMEWSTTDMWVGRVG
jgi:hypothetical protein